MELQAPPTEGVEAQMPAQVDQRLRPLLRCEHGRVAGFVSLSPEAHRDLPRELAPGELLEAIAPIHRDCFGWALACCGRSRSDAEDVLQAVYLEIWRRKARFLARSSLKTWVFGVIRRTAASQRRKRNLSALLHSRLAAEPPVQVVPTPAGHSEEGDRRRILIQALGRLSTRQREVLELVFYHDLTLEESASVLSISVGSARVHYDRGKRRLRELLVEEP